MNAITNITTPETNDFPLAMGSREIAKLTGKRHDNVVRDIRNMLTTLFGEGGVLNFQHMYIHPQNGQSYPEYQLPKDLTITVIAGYSAVMRHRIVTRMMELEQQAKARPQVTHQSFIEALRQEANQQEAAERLA